MKTRGSIAAGVVAIALLGVALASGCATASSGDPEQAATPPPEKVVLTGSLIPQEPEDPRRKRHPKAFAPVEIDRRTIERTGAMTAVDALRSILP